MCVCFAIQRLTAASVHTAQGHYICVQKHKLQAGDCICICSWVFVFVYVLWFCLSSLSRRVLVWLPELVALVFVAAMSSFVRVVSCACTLCRNSVSRISSPLPPFDQRRRAWVGGLLRRFCSIYYACRLSCCSFLSPPLSPSSLMMPHRCLLLMSDVGLM